MSDASPPPYLSGSGGSGSGGSGSGGSGSGGSGSGGPSGGAQLPPPAGRSPAGSGATGLTFDGGGAKPAGKNRTGIIVGAIVVAALVVVGIVALGGGGDGGGDVEQAAEGFEAVIDDAEFVDGVADLRRCPVGDVEELAAAVAGRVEIDEEVLEGDEGNTAGDDGVEYISCGISADASDVRGVYGLAFGANAVPRGDYEDYLAEVFDDVEVEDPRSRSGGQVYAYCNDDSDAGPGNCGADWVVEEHDIVFFVVLNGGSDAEDAVAALDAVRSDMVSALAEQAGEG